jgi:hypothetical protein
MNTIWSRWDQNWLVHDDTVLTGTPDDDTARPVSNLLVPHLVLPWRALALTAVLEADCTVARLFRVFGLFGLRNLTASATIELKLSNSAAGDDGVYGSGVLAMAVDRGFDQWTLALPAALSARYLQMTIEDPGNAESHIDIGLAWAGQAIETSINPLYGFAPGHDDPSQGQATPGGQTYIDRRRIMRVASGRYSDLDETQAREDIRELGRIGTNQSCLFLPDPNAALAPRQAICGQLQKSTRLTFDGPGRMGFNFEIRERL